MQNMWKQFCETGMVTDYLSYCKEREEDERETIREKQAGAKRNAAGYSCYRDDFGGTASGRI